MQITPDTALVLIDLQQGILALPTAHDSGLVLERGVRLAEAFRARRLPVALVRVGWHADGGDLPLPGDAATPAVPPAGFSDLSPALGPAPDDLVVTKRHWGAFTGTELDLQLRRRGVRHIVLGGISTSIGVESTARSAWELTYRLTFATDAMTDLDGDSHLHSTTKIFPRLGHVTTTEEVLAALPAPS
ncbi:isochorismatase family protein [Kitasatospora sp. NPDC096147]|uniref:isochorismatase family protein n=1 Tax=Kitasatospora sp. NPDC096147 TaxID=3364093 RepID=UPI0037FAF02A